MKNFARMMLRMVVGGSLAAHGAQKLFGAFGGAGPAGTGVAFEEHIGLEPGDVMAVLAGAGEFGGGLATALGVGGPLGPTTIASTMAVAATTGHRGKPYFAQSGGPEMAVVYAAIGAYLAIDGFGRDSLVDRTFGIKVPRTLAVAYAGAAAFAARALIMRARQAQDEARAAQLREAQQPPLPMPTKIRPQRATA